MTEILKKNHDKFLLDLVLNRPTNKLKKYTLPANLKTSKDIFIRNRFIRKGFCSKKVSVEDFQFLYNE